MRRLESDFRSNVSDYLKEEAFSCQDIESGLTGLGIPDTFFASKRHAVSGWIEYKIIRESLQDCIKIPYRPGQFAWLTLYSMMGVLCILAIECELGWAFFKNEGIKKWYSREELASAILTEPFEIISWMKGD
jgi:hypothetical protein